MLSRSRGAMLLEWSPDVPPPRSLSKKEIEQYRAGRDALIEQVAAILGGSILVLEV